MDWTKTYRKAVTFSYDDGNEQDIRLVEMLNRYGLKCTFNLNSGLDGRSGDWQYKGAWVHRMHLPDCTELYKGHEIAVHGSRHLCLTELSREEMRTEIRSDAAELTRIFGTTPVGMAYAYGAYNADVIEEIVEAGLQYARTTHSTHHFDVQQNLLEFKATCHHDDEILFDLAKQFLSENSDAPQIFYIWGHSYEFDGNHNWDRFERLCEMLAGKPDVFYGTNREVLL
ncbi:MAG: polysaccharide deacetylase family protein [Oscillospiraceae bacterium]|nr:polysaccharide deacetylase family protein [Oscillospiraceae bacterium]